MRVLDDWLLTPAKTAVHLPTATAVLADLHLGYSLVRRGRGDAIPDVDVASVLAPLVQVRSSANFTRVVVAGDLFESADREALVDQLIAWFSLHGLELSAVVPGNHDGSLARLSVAGVPVHPEGFQLGRWRIVHGDQAPAPPFRVQGHEHPCLRWQGGVNAACYLVGADHLILPAFSPDAAGVDVVRDPRWRNHRCIAVAGEQLLDFGVLCETFRAGTVSRSSSKG
jgi:putative SbcD/Mre11-related phosphoesterase